MKLQLILLLEFEPLIQPILLKYKVAENNSPIMNITPIKIIINIIRFEIFFNEHKIFFSPSLQMIIDSNISIEGPFK